MFQESPVKSQNEVKDAFDEFGSDIDDEDFEKVLEQLDERQNKKVGSP